jgi:hypothetical protein
MSYGIRAAVPWNDEPPDRVCLQPLVMSHTCIVDSFACLLTARLLGIMLPFVPVMCSPAMQVKGCALA